MIAMMCIIQRLLLPFFIFSPTIFAVGSELQCESSYQIIIDGGSTGSRLHVYFFSSSSQSFRRIGDSARAWTPLTDYAPTDDGRMLFTPQEVAEHLLPTFISAMETIPSEHWECTPVTYAATAGMRLLTKHDQDLIYDALYQGLIHSKLSIPSLQKTPIHWPFRQFKRSDIFTLGGDEEGLYGMMAANYLSGIVHADLSVKTEEGCITPQQGWEDADQEIVTTAFVGALDMGGSSTQIVFHPGTTNTPYCQDGADLERSRSQLNHTEFFSTSYLSYGVFKFRERLWEVLVEEHGKEEKVIENPCLFPGFTTTFHQYTFLGTGNSSNCELLVQRLLPNLDLSHEKGWVSAEREMERVVGGIYHPPIRGKFYAMSLYFFALDCLRELSYHLPYQRELKEQLQREWPSPRLQQLRHAVEVFCARSWIGVSRVISC